MFAMSVRASNPDPARVPLEFPRQTVRRCVSTRFGTVCFWVLLMLFLLLLAYLGMLAFSSYNGALQTSAFVVGPDVGGIGLGFIAVSFIAACMASRPRRY